MLFNIKLKAIKTKRFLLGSKMLAIKQKSMLYSTPQPSRWNLWMPCSVLLVWQDIFISPTYH